MPVQSGIEGQINMFGGAVDTPTATAVETPTGSPAQTMQQQDQGGTSATNTSTTTAAPRLYRWQRRTDPAAIKGMTTPAFMNRLIDSGAYKPWGDPFAGRFKTQVKSIYQFHGKPIHKWPLKFSTGHTQADWRDDHPAGRDINRLGKEMERRGGPRQAGLRNVLKGFNVGDMNRLRSAMMGAMTPNELAAFQRTMSTK